MGKSDAIALLVVLFVCLGSAALAGTHVEVSPAISYLTGDSTYSIGDAPPELDPWGRDPYFPISQLKFPLGVVLGKLNAKVTIDKLVLSGSISRSITDEAGNMRDYDWGVPYWSDTGSQGAGWYVKVWTDGTREWYMLDVESNSESEVDVLMWDTAVSWQIYSEHYDYKYRDPFAKQTYRYSGDILAYADMGFKKRTFNYECSLIRQWSPSGIPDQDYVGDGSVGLTYDVSYSIPYIGFTFADRGTRFTTEMSIGYSPYVMAKDRDDHLIRIPGPIHSRGDCTGNALMVAAGLRYNITPNWFIKGDVDYLYLRTYGTQDAVIYAGSSNGHAWDYESWSLDERIVSRQASYTLGIGFCF